MAFAATLQATDHVALEATGNALAIARLLEPHVARVVIANSAAIKGIGSARAKTDQLDARTLAQLLSAGFLPGIWAGDEPTRLARRRMSRRAQLVRERTRLKNQVHAVLHRNLAERAPASDLFGVKGRRWLGDLALPTDEEETVLACLRQLDFLGDELRRLDEVIAKEALTSEDIRRLLTVPGVNLATAAAFMAAVGDIRRFRTPRCLVSYLGLDPSVRQSGLSAARHGGISKQGSAGARHALVESAWVIARSPGPLHAFGQRVRARRGTNVATVAVARKLAVLFWHMLTKGEDYAFARPSLTTEKLRRLELSAGAPTTRGKRTGGRVYASHDQYRRELAVLTQAEAAYRRLVADRTSHGGAKSPIAT
jgi:transposase